MENKFSVKKLALVGVFSALVFASSMISIPIPSPVGIATRIHLGNVMCLLSGLILGPVYGGLSAGIGSMFYDFTNPLYIASAPFTFAFKFLMAFTAGIIAKMGRKKKSFQIYNIIGAVSGALFYVFLYLSRTYIVDVYFNNIEHATAIIDISQKGIVSTLNAIIAVIVSVLLFSTIKKVMEKSNLNL